MDASSPQKKTNLWRAVDPSLALAAVCTVAFYALLFSPMMEKTILHRYTTEHIVDYVIVALFIWGLVDICLKLSSFPREMLALRRTWLAPRSGRQPVEEAETMLADVQNQPAWAQQAKIGKRLIGVLEHAKQNSSAEEYREHLHYLREQDDDNTHANYTLVRFAIAITPILGFLGTVVHFGTALSGISFEQMTEKLPVVVGEMGQAFNTTTVALAASMSLMFLLFFCERIENSILIAVNRLVERELMNRFEMHDAIARPEMAGVQATSHAALEAVRATLARQVELWSEALNALFQRLDVRQEQQLRAWQQALGAQGQQLQVVVEQMQAGQGQLAVRVESSLDRAQALRNDFNELMTALHRIGGGEEKLHEVQSLLTHNLQVLRETQQFDEALHGLTAAIHLLTARHRSGPEAAAA